MSRSQAFDGAQDTARAVWLRLRRALSAGRPAAMLAPSTLFRAARHLVAPKTVSASDKAADKPLRPTAYLDGLRGFAAFLVYWHHHELWAHMYPPGRTEDIFENSWGRKGEYHLATFYGTRLFFTGGHIAVAIFYVISGYVLTLKALQCIQNGQHARVADVVASALFRRWFRLYIPVLVTTFVLITVWHLFGIWNPQTEPKPTYAAEVWNWYTEFKNLSFIFKEGPMWPSYNGHLWSIPLEMRGSIITYVAALTLFRATTKARLLCELGLVFYFMYICDAWYGSVFMTGMLQCDLDLLARRSEPNSGFPSFLRRLEPHKKKIYYALLVLALFFSGVPSHSRDVDEFRSNPGWYYLFYLKPSAVFDAKWFFLAIAANCLVAAIPRIPWLKRFFEGRFCQYLGRISFSLYLVHGPIMHMLGDRLYHAVGFVAPFQARQEKYGRLINSIPLPIAGPLGLEPAFLLPHVILLPVTLWISDIVTRHVDEPAVKFSQWMWNSIQQPKEQTSPSSSSLATPLTVTRLENGHAAAALRTD